MKRTLFAAVTLAAATWLTGCGGGGGGGGGGTPPPTDKFTRPVVNIDWPERSRSLAAPSSALSVVIKIKASKTGGADYDWVINREAGTAAVTTRYVGPSADLKVGTWDVVVNFHAEQNGQGAVVATAGDRVTFTEAGTGLDSLAVTGVIATVEVPAGQNVPTGTKTDLLFNAKDSSGNIIAVTPGSAVWRVTSGATVLRFVNGQAEATGNGTAKVTATVDNKTSPETDVIAGTTTGDLTINVKDAAGTLVKPADVELFQGTTKLDGKSTATGTVNFTKLAPGDYIIKATATGYQPGETTATVTVGATETKDVALVQNGAILASIKDPTSSLIPGVQIEVWQGGVKVAEKTSTTGAETFPNLKPGAAEVRAAAGGFHSNQGTTTVVSGQTVTVGVTLAPRGKPQATVSPTRQVSLNGNLTRIEMDISVRDEDGNHIAGIAPSSFTIEPVTIGTVTYTFDQRNSTEMNLGLPQPYSAFISLDNSQSVKDNDPNGSRLQATKTFFSALGPTDTAAFGHFPAANGSVNLVTYPDIGFVGPNDASRYYEKIDGLTQRFAGTPLYTATSQAIDFTHSLGVNPNKAVIVFTDGESTEVKSKRDQMIANAKAKNVRLYMVGLGPETDTNELAFIASSTGGTVMYATDAQQLVSFYKTLGSLLSGSGSFYRQAWHVTKSEGTFSVGENFTAIMKVKLGDGTVLLAPLQVVIR